MNKIYYTYGGVSRHEFLIGITDTVVNEFYGKPKKEDGQPYTKAMDAWQEIYVSLMEILNERTDLHDQERPGKDDPVHYGAKRILLAEARAIRGRLEAGEKTNAHEEVDNKRVKALLKEAVEAGPNTSGDDELVLQAFSELPENYRDLLTDVVIEGKASEDRRKLSRALTSLGNKIDLKFSKHTVSLYVTDDEGNETAIEPSADPTELTIDEIIEQYDHSEDHLDYSESDHHDVLEDLVGSKFPVGFEEAVTETIVKGYGIDTLLYFWCNNQGTTDPNLKKAWDFLTNDEKELLLIRYNRGYKSKFKRQYHEQSVAVRNKLEKIWLEVDTYVPESLLESAVELVEEMCAEVVTAPVEESLEGPFKAPESVVEELSEPEPVEVPQSFSEALETVSSGLNSLEEFLADGFSNDPKFLSAWEQMDYDDRWTIEYSARPDLPEKSRRLMKARVEEATDKYMKLYKEMS